MDNKPQLTLSEKCEFAGSVFWLLMDYCYFLGSQRWAFGLIAPTVLAHFLALAFGEKKLAYVVVYSALNSWVIANSLWLISDFSEIGSFAVAADVFFKLAIALTSLVIFLSFKNRSLKIAFRLFRRFRIKL